MIEDVIYGVMLKANTDKFENEPPVNASKKLNKKQCDLIIANHLKTEGAGFQGDTNVVTIITQDSMKDIDKMSKSDLSYIILKECMKIGAKK